MMGVVLYGFPRPRRTRSFVFDRSAIPFMPWGEFEGRTVGVRGLYPQESVYKATASEDGETGTETTETTRIEYFFVAPIRNIVVRELVLFATYHRIYVDTADDTYHYRWYWQLCEAFPKDASGTGVPGWEIRALTAEELIFELTRGPAASAGWTNHYNPVQRVYRGLLVRGYLTVRWRGTSWTDGGSMSGAGLANLGSIGYVGATLWYEEL